MRHGEGFHNVAGRIDHENYKSWDYEDSHLTEYGWKQVSSRVAAAEPLLALSSVYQLHQQVFPCYGLAIGHHIAQYARLAYSTISLGGSMTAAGSIALLCPVAAANMSSSNGLARM